jgi:hypothetical protein
MKEKENMAALINVIIYEIKRGVDHKNWMETLNSS